MLLNNKLLGLVAGMLILSVVAGINAAPSREEIILTEENHYFLNDGINKNSVREAISNGET